LIISNPAQKDKKMADTTMVLRFNRVTIGSEVWTNEMLCERFDAAAPRQAVQISHVSFRPISPAKPVYQWEVDNPRASGSFCLRRLHKKDGGGVAIEILEGLPPAITFHNEDVTILGAMSAKGINHLSPESGILIGSIDHIEF
jgi:hypothetical protein